MIFAQVNGVCGLKLRKVTMNSQINAVWRLSENRKPTAEKLVLARIPHNIR